MSGVEAEQSVEDEEWIEELYKTEESCRICKVASQEPLISPCDCKGSLAFVHTSCLQRWLQTNSRTACEICLYHFKTYLERKYTFCQAVRLWLRNRRRRLQAESDACHIALLSVVMSVVIFICLYRLDHAADIGSRNGVSKFWTTSIMGFFLALLIVTYGWAIAYIVKRQTCAFLTWWRSTHNIILQLQDHSHLDSNLNRMDNTPTIQIVVQ